MRSSIMAACSSSPGCQETDKVISPSIDLLPPLMANGARPSTQSLNSQAAYSYLARGRVLGYCGGLLEPLAFLNYSSDLTYLLLYLLLFRSSLDLY
jgi:hypothetical protein